MGLEGWKLGRGREVASPKGRIPRGDVYWDETSKELRIKLPREPRLTKVGPTNSMEPLMDDGQTTCVMLAVPPEDHTLLARSTG